jgi:hypothetical protein
MTCGGVGVAAVGNDGSQLTKVTPLARKHHRGRLDARAREAGRARCIWLIAYKDPEVKLPGGFDPGGESTGAKPSWQLASGHLTDAGR